MEENEEMENKRSRGENRRKGRGKNKSSRGEKRKCK